MYPFSYEVIIYNPHDDDYNYYKHTGMGFANSYADAANKLETYYGEDLSAITHLELYEESSLLLLPKDVIYNYSHEKYEIEIPCTAEGEKLIKGE